MPNPHKLKWEHKKGVNLKTQHLSRHKKMTQRSTKLRITSLRSLGTLYKPPIKISMEKTHRETEGQSRRTERRREGKEYRTRKEGKGMEGKKGEEAPSYGIRERAPHSGVCRQRGNEPL
jgi:hypothetical protein